ncbi:MAG: hypothetical protein K0B81_01745 [Candidatus Cloacimonetes bacterium]|nr:hypothetical protein [Candidatus Cloacimonadota bacterium]
MYSFKTLVVNLFMLLFITLAFASESRMFSMGSVYGFLRDDTDVMIYPGSIHRYNRLVFAEMRSWNNKSNWSVGGNIPFYTNVFGFRFNVPTELDLYDFDYDSGPYRDWDVIDMDHKINFIFGFMDNFGLGFGMAMDQANYTLQVYEEEGSIIELEFSIDALLLEFMGGYSNEMFDLGLTMQLPNGILENEVSLDKGELSGLLLGLNGRYFIIDEDNVSMMTILDIKLSNTSFEFKHYDEDTLFYTEKDDHSLLGVSFGIGINYQINDNNLLVLGLKPLGMTKTAHEEEYLLINADKEVTKIEQTITTLPEYRVGLESRISSWLTGRVGAYQQYHFIGYEKNFTYGDQSYLIEKYSYYESNFNVSIGFAVNFRNFTIDGVLSDSFLFDGPNFIGGKSNGIATQLSLKYSF